MPSFLLLVLEAPLMAFGREMVDARGPISDFPSASLLTGLLANALGWRREERDWHARLQARLRFAARLDRPGQRLTDFQTVRLAKDDSGWTTHGRREGRAGGAGTYESPHIRQRDFDADKRIVVALTLLSEEDTSLDDPGPTIQILAEALQRPRRPLFLGRKCCLPSAPLLYSSVEADGLWTALAGVPVERDTTALVRWQEKGNASVQILLPLDEAPEQRGEVILVSDQRDWHSGVHGGQRRMRIVQLPGINPEALPDRIAGAGT